MSTTKRYLTHRLPLELSCCIDCGRRLIDFLVVSDDETTFFCRIDIEAMLPDMKGWRQIFDAGGTELASELYDSVGACRL